MATNAKALVVGLVMIHERRCAFYENIVAFVLSTLIFFVGFLCEIEARHRFYIFFSVFFLLLSVHNCN